MMDLSKNARASSGSSISTKQEPGVEAEDIVAGAIKLNVDDDLNEQQEDTNASEDNNASENGNYEQSNNQSDYANDDEPNYEVDDEEIELADVDEQTADADFADQETRESRDEENVTNGEEQQFEQVDGSLTEDVNQANAGDLSQSAANLKQEESAGSKNIKDSKIDADEKKEDKKKSSKDTKKDSKSSSKSSKSSNSNSNSKSKSTKDVKDFKDLKDNKASNKDAKMEKSTGPHIDQMLWVSNLSGNVRASDLQDLFKKHGRVLSTKIIKNTRIPGSRFYGLITMETAEQAVNCIKELNKVHLDGRSITVEKNKLMPRKKRDLSRERDMRKDDDRRPRDRDDRGRRAHSPRRRSKSPPRRFAGRIQFNSSSGPASANRRPQVGFSARGRGSFNGRLSYGGGRTSPYSGRKNDNDRVVRDRERDEEERARLRRAREAERRAQEEREKLEREKLRIKVERERLEREKNELLRLEREKARQDRERLEREREEILRKKTQLTHRIDEPRAVSGSRQTSLNSSGKRVYEDSYGWDDRKRFATDNLLPPARPAFVESERFVDYRQEEFDRRKLESLTAAPVLPRASEYEGRRSLESGRDRDDRRSSNGSSTLNFYRESIRSGGNSNLLNTANERAMITERSSRSGLSGSMRTEQRDWKGSSGNHERRDSRFLDKSPLSTGPPSGNGSYISRGYNSSETRVDWPPLAERSLPPSANISKLGYGSSNYY